MPEQSELSKAIVAAADREFSTFKDVIGDALEQRFRDKIDSVTKDKANKIFNPDYVDPSIEADTDDTTGDAPDDSLDDTTGDASDTTGDVPDTTGDAPDTTPDDSGEPDKEE